MKDCAAVPFVAKLAELLNSVRKIPVFQHAHTTPERFCFPPAKYTYHGNKRERCFIVLYKCGSLRGNFNARPLMLRAALLLFWRSAASEWESVWRYVPACIYGYMSERAHIYPCENVYIKYIPTAGRCVAAGSAVIYAWRTPETLAAHVFINKVPPDYAENSLAPNNY